MWYTGLSYTRAIKGEHSSSSKTDILIYISHTVCWLLLKTGFNAMFGHQFAKTYHYQYGICVEAIYHLCLHGNPSEINDFVHTISGAEAAAKKWRGLINIHKS